MGVMVDVGRGCVSVGLSIRYKDDKKLDPGPEGDTGD